MELILQFKEDEFSKLVDLYERIALTYQEEHPGRHFSSFCQWCESLLNSAAKYWEEDTP